LIDHYHLEPHPGGGWYKENYRSPEYIPKNALPARFGATRSFCTVIYFLLEQGQFSAFHKIKSDECWHFYGGGTLELYIIDDAGSLQKIHLGNDLTANQYCQYVVPAGYWFAGHPARESEYSFVGCTVAPGFDFEDFSLGEPVRLSELYPQHEKTIFALCR
jgi:predicted cupin superfamily sugar epimerase